MCIPAPTRGSTETVKTAGAVPPAGAADSHLASPVDTVYSSPANIHTRVQYADLVVGAVLLEGGQADVFIVAAQGGAPYRVPLQIALEVDGRIERRTLEIKRAREVERFPLATAPTSLDVERSPAKVESSTVSDATVSSS